MEVLGVVGGLAAVLQLANAASRCASTLIRFSKNAGSASLEIAHLANQINTFHQSVHVAHLALSRHCSAYTESPVIAYIASSDLLGGLGDESRYVRTQVKEARKRIVSMESKYRLWAAIRWSFSRDSILGLSPQMDSIKHSLTLVMQTAQLEVMMMERERLSPDMGVQIAKWDEDM